jgi:GNAT superfamily N-acetyltransferase
MGRLMVGEVRPGDPAIDELVRLGKRYSKTLGLMPAGAFRDAAHWGGLVAARIDERPVGYALFRLPRSNRVMLSHLCVDQEARGSGVARALLKEITAKHSSRLGILAKCRNDYELNTMWEKLGFQARATVLGRGKDHSPMTVWCLDHGVPDLFTSTAELDPLADEPDLLEAALDLNILMDLHIRPDRPTARRSQVLLADHLEGRLRLVTTNGTDRELANRSPAQRVPIEQAASHYPRRAAATHQADQMFTELVRASAGENLSTQDRGDLWQIAEAVTAGVGVLLTWDDALRKRFVGLQRTIPALGSFRVLDPDHLVTHLDQVARAWAYQPARLHGSDFDQVLAGADDEPHLAAFLGKASGETRGELRGAIRALAREGVPRWLIRTAGEPAVACYAARLDGEILRVPLLRTAEHPLADTIARQLLWVLRRDARDQGARVIDIADRHVGGVLTRAMAAEPFHHHDDHRYAWLAPVCGTSLDINRAATEARRLVGVGPGQLLRPGLPARAAVEVERSLWPAKLLDSDLPHYVIPIQPRWSADLIGYPEQLTSRRTELSLGREQVYYRAADKLLTAPARILWRVSQSRINATEIVATSFLDAIEVDTPARLHAALKHYGVFDLNVLEQHAGNSSTMQALRFSDTELFVNPISTRHYERLRAQHGGPRAFYGPQRIQPELFGALYQAGTE